MLVRYLRQIDRGKYDPSVLSLLAPGPLKHHITDLNIKLAAIGMSESQFSLAAFRNLRREFRRAGPDLVHGWMYHGNVAASVGSMIGSKKPVIWSIHHSVDDIRTEKRMTRWIIRLSATLSKHTAAISYCSKVAAEQHEKMGFDPSKRHIIPNGTDCEEFRPNKSARPALGAILGIPDKRLVIGNVARFHPMKDHENLVRAVAILVQQGLDVQGLIIGAGHEKGGARKTARALGIDERISILGPRDDIPAIMPGLDIYALSSSWGEAFPLAVSEAMACGVPSVATDLGDCSWLIGDPDLIVPPKDPQALASTLMKLVKLTRTERSKLGLRARGRIIENFSLHNYVQRHKILYEQALIKQPS
jgi:glycosyltransferase involved in cell wall biosynthesis